MLPFERANLLGQMIGLQAALSDPAAFEATLMARL